MGSQFTQYMSKYNFPVSQILAGRLSRELWPVSVKPLSDNRLSDEHWHENIQIWYTISGEYMHKINGIWFKQTPGSVIIVHPYSLHQIDSTKSNLDELNVISMSVPREMFLEENVPFSTHSYALSSFDFLSIAASLQISGNDKNRADVLTSDCLSEFFRQRDMDIRKIFLGVAAFLEICARQNASPFSRKEIINAKTKFECVDNALSYIFENSAEPITLEQISREAMMSQRSFTSAFSEIVGRTCHSYVMATRMCNALNLMKNSDCSLDEIAERCGFYDRTHFIRLFRNRFGTTPTLWKDDFLKWKEENEYYELMSECRFHGWLRPDAVERLEKMRL